MTVRDSGPLGSLRGFGFERFFTGINFKYPYPVLVRMKRRNFIASVALASTAGCSSIESLTGPKYEDVNEQDMYLDESDFPDNWKKFPEINEEYTIYGTEVDRIYVGQDIAIYDSEKDAQNSFKKMEQSFQDLNYYELASDAFWVLTEDDFAIFIFRDSNALGQVVAIKQSGLEAQPDRQRAINYAEMMHEHWQTLV